MTPYLDEIYSSNKEFLSTYIYGVIKELKVRKNLNQMLKMLSLAK